MPDEMVKEYYKKTTNSKKLAKIFGVSNQAMEIRLKNLGM